jgi:hypothetical protein
MDPLGPVQTPGYVFLGEGYMTQGRMGGGTGFLVKSRWLGAVQLRWRTLRASDVAPPKRSQEGRPLVVVSAYLRPVSATRTQADWQSDLAALSQDILHWQQKSATVVVCEIQRTHWSPRCRSKRAITSPNSEGTDAQGASLVETLSECSLFSLDRTGPDPEYTCHRTQASVVDYWAPLGS